MKVQHWRDVEALPVADVPGATIRWAIDDRDGAPNFALRVIEVPAGQAIQLHDHPWEHEIFVLAGQGRVQEETTEAAMQEGDVIFIPPGRRHGFFNQGQGPLRFICVVPMRAKQG